MQGIGRRRHPGHRRCAIPGRPEAGGSRTGFSNQRTDPGKGRTTGPATKDGTRAQA